MKQTGQRSNVRRLLIVSGLLAMLGGGAFGWVQLQAGAEPESSVATCGEAGWRGAGPVVVALGDSLTRGRMSADYVGALRARLGDEARVINAGHNGEMAHNVRARIKALKPCNPDVVVLLVGTNDYGATLSEKAMEKAQSDLGHPGPPSLATFTATFAGLLEDLQRALPEARLIVVTPPPLGEASELKTLSTPWRQAVAEAARTRELTVVPFYTRLLAGLAESASGEGRCAEGEVHVLRAQVMHHLLGYTWDEIADGLGFTWLTDCVHLNDRAAALLADMVASAINDGWSAPRPPPSPGEPSE